jgi:uncharacterized protein YndB with AHSA1/START domain
MRHKGTVVIDDAFATITFYRSYPHAVEHVWDAIATPEGLRGWLMCTHAEIEGHAGGRIETVSGPPGYHSTGHVLVWEPPRCLEYEWNVAPVPEMPHGQRAIFRYELTPSGGTTHLVVTYRRITKETATGFLPGLHAFLDRLEAQLDGNPLPDWLERFTAARAEYPEWSGHAPDAGK